jgi:hypothetical protein
VRASLIVVIAVALAAVLAASLYTFSLPQSYTNMQSSPNATANLNGQIGVTENMTDANSVILSRGNVAMGFDQNKIMHHFMATSAGGQIRIVALDNNDSETISQIKTHVLDIQYEFSQGNFTKPILHT